MVTAPQLLYQKRYDLGECVEGTCYICGGALYKPLPIKDVVKTTFNDYQNVHTDGTDVCVACQWFMIIDRRTDLQEWLGRDKAQSPRTYSHIAVGKQWHILSKGQKAEILDLLIGGVMPEVCIIAVSGQKHLFYKARPNPSGQSMGWVLYEEQHVWIDQADFVPLVNHVKALYLPDYGFSKDGILTGRYNFNKPESLDLYLEHEPFVTQYRGSLMLDLAVYLVTKPESEDV